MRRIALLVVSAIALGATSCRQTPACRVVGVKPAKPAVVRQPAAFGPVTSDPLHWTVGPFRASQAVIVVGGRQFVTDSRTRRFGYCEPPKSDPTQCAAFVALRRPGLAAWVLMASREPQAAGNARLEVLGMTIWKVRPASLVLSQGAELGFGRAFAKRLKSTGLRAELEGPQTGAELYIDAHDGEVVDASAGIGGCE